MASDSPGPAPRERIVLSQRRGARMVRTRIEVQEQTAVGDALVRGLVRAQLGLALRLSAVVLCVAFAIPLLGTAFPDLETLTVFGVRANWLVLGVALYPLFYLVGRVYIRLAEQSERDFMGIVDEGADDGTPAP